MNLNFCKVPFLYCLEVAVLCSSKSNRSSFAPKGHDAAVVCNTKETAQQRRRRWLLFLIFCRLVIKTSRTKKNILIS